MSLKQLLRFLRFTCSTLSLDFCSRPYRSLHLDLARLSIIPAYSTREQQLSASSLPPPPTLVSSSTRSSRRLCFATAAPRAYQGVPLQPGHCGEKTTALSPSTSSLLAPLEASSRSLASQLFSLAVCQRVPTSVDRDGRSVLQTRSTSSFPRSAAAQLDPLRGGARSLADPGLHGRQLYRRSTLMVQ